MDKLKTILKTTSIYGWADLSIAVFLGIAIDNIFSRALFTLFTLVALLKIYDNKYYNKSEFNVLKENRKPYVQYEIDCNKLLLFGIISLSLVIVVCAILSLSKIVALSIVFIISTVIIVKNILLFRKRLKSEEIIENNKNTL